MAASSTSASYAPQMNEQLLLGHGEYVAFYEGGGKVDRDTFEKVYKIFNENSPAAIANSHTESVKELCANRYDRIRGAVKEADPNLHIAFVPKTLYELVCIKKCIEEDVNAGELCRYLVPSNWSSKSPLSEEEHETYRKARDCWHRCLFDFHANISAWDDEPKDKDGKECNDAAGAREVAFRLNQVIVEELSPGKEGFTFEEVSKHTESHIKFLKEHYETYDKEIDTQCSNENPEPASVQGIPTKKLEPWQRRLFETNRHPLFRCVGPGPTSNFAFPYSRGSCAAMTICDDKYAQLIRNALAIDCSEVAKKAFILYRGNYRLNTPLETYGSGLFSHAIYAGQSSPFYWIMRGVYSYAISIPYEDLKDSPFKFSPTNTVVQLFTLDLPALGHPNVKDGATAEEIEKYEEHPLVLCDIRESERIRIYGNEGSASQQGSNKQDCTIA